MGMPISTWLESLILLYLARENCVRKIHIFSGLGLYTMYDSGKFTKHKPVPSLLSIAHGFHMPRRKYLAIHGTGEVASGEIPGGLKALGEWLKESRMHLCTSYNSP